MSLSKVTFSSPIFFFKRSPSVEPPPLVSSSSSWLGSRIAAMRSPISRRYDSGSSPERPLHGMEDEEGAAGTRISRDRLTSTSRTATVPYSETSILREHATSRRTSPFCKGEGRRRENGEREKRGRKNVSTGGRRASRWVLLERVQGNSQKPKRSEANQP